jgi:hypothetical protein
MKKWANDLNRAFSKKEVQMAKKHMKKLSTFVAIKEMEIKTIGGRGKREQGRRSDPNNAHTGE